MGCSRYLGAKLKRAPIRKPPRIRSGDVVGVIAPAGAVDGERLSAGAAVLEGWALRVQVGSDEERLVDLVQMIDDARVRAIFCARGGYGSQRLLPRLDLGRLARQPKPIIGYSDATALLGAAVEAGVLAVHGPMVADDMARGLSERSAAHLQTLLTDPAWRWEAEAPITIRPGKATGRLVGGCLAVLVAALGTPCSARRARSSASRASSSAPWRRARRSTAWARSTSCARASATCPARSPSASPRGTLRAAHARRTWRSPSASRSRSTPSAGASPRSTPRSSDV